MGPIDCRVDRVSRVDRDRKANRSNNVGRDNGVNSLRVKRISGVNVANEVDGASEVKKPSKVIEAGGGLQDTNPGVRRNLSSEARPEIATLAGG